MHRSTIFVHTIGKYKYGGLIVKKIYKVLLLIGILTICAAGCGQKKVKDDRGELVRAGEIPRSVFVQKESSKSLKA